MEYMENQMDNQTQSGLSERDEMISDLEKWQSTAKELAEALENMVFYYEDDFYVDTIINPSKSALQTYKTLTNGK